MSRELPSGTDEFVRVGEEITVHDGILDLASAEELRRFIAMDFLATTNSRVSNLDYDSDKIAYSRSHVIFTSDGRDASRFVGAILTHWPDAWRLAVLVSRTCRAGWNNGEQRIGTRYALECHGYSIVQARKQVRLIRPVGELLVDHIASGTPPDIQRRMFERQMSATDCLELRHLLAQTAKRSAI